MHKLLVWLCLGFVTTLSLYTYFYNFSNPQAFFWDENYHVASAQKYLNGVYFMEQHPPLGKLLIALGEKIVHGNEKNDQFIGTDYAQNPPRGFVLTGYRLFPALLAWLGAPLLYLIFLLLTNKPIQSTIYSFPYIFDNALIVHMRGAMLEGPLLFFSLLVLVSFLLVLRWRHDPRKLIGLSVMFGASFGLVLTTKVVGLVFILLLPIALGYMIPDWRKALRVTGLFIVGFLVSYIAVWHTHFSLGSRIVSSNNDNGYYQASEAYKNILSDGSNGSLMNFPVMINDSWAYVSHYNNGVPKLDLAKPDENGSPFFFWPFGARSINYRWETAEGKIYRYLYLQSNPLVWSIGLIGVFLSVVLILGTLIFNLQQRLANRRMLLVFLLLYMGYMGAVSQIDRVMYLYHYFLPLLFSFILFALSYEEIGRLGLLKCTEFGKTVVLILLGASMVLTYQFYRPLSYYEPLSDDAFKRRDIFPLWDLRCVNCERHNFLFEASAGS